MWTSTPGRVGDTLETTFEVGEPYQRNGKSDVVSQMQIYDQAGAFVCNGLIIQG